MTKIELAGKISASTGMEKKQSIQFIEAFMESVKQALCEGNNIYLRGFGTFRIYKRKEKPARVISRNEQIMVPAHHICKFKPVKPFAKKLMQSIPVK